MDRNKIEKDFCRRFNRDPKSIPVVGLSYLETISISRSFRPDLTSNRIDSCFRPLLLPANLSSNIFPFNFSLPFGRFFLATRQRNNRSIRNDSDVYARESNHGAVCSYFFSWKKKKRKRKEKDRKFLRVEETLEKKESRNLSFKALKSHLPMVASDVKQSTPLSHSLFLSLSFRYFSAFPTSRVYLLHLRHVGEKRTCRD